MDKTELPPSKDKHDYYTPKPYFWPNPHTASGLPYIRMDGQRVPGTELYDEQSHRVCLTISTKQDSENTRIKSKRGSLRISLVFQFDRTRLASMYGNTTCLALAYYFTGASQYAEKAAQNVHVWFLNPDTAMSPSSKYAQVCVSA